MIPEKLCTVQNGSGFNMGGSNYFLQCNAGYCASSPANIVSCVKGVGFKPPFECNLCEIDEPTTTTTTTKVTEPLPAILNLLENKTDKTPETYKAAEAY